MLLPGQGIKKGEAMADKKQIVENWMNYEEALKRKEEREAKKAAKKRTNVLKDGIIVEGEDFLGGWKNVEKK